MLEPGINLFFDTNFWQVAGPILKEVVRAPSDPKV